MWADLPDAAGLITIGLAVFFLAAVIQAATGFGAALFSMPALLLFLPAEDALFASCLAGALLAGWGAITDRGHISRPQATRLTLAAVAGMPLGLVLLLRLEDQTIRLITLSVVVIAILSGLRRTPGVVSAGGVTLCGLTSGALLACSGVNGPPNVMALRSLPPARYRATLQSTFSLQDVAVVLALVVLGRATQTGVVVSAAGLLAVPFGWRLGSLLFARVDERRLRVMTLLMLLATLTAILVDTV